MTPRRSARSTTASPREPKLRPSSELPAETPSESSGAPGGRSKAVACDPRTTTNLGRRVVRVLCVDDHAMLIAGLKALFAIRGELEIVESLSSAERLLEEVERLQPDVVLLDIEMRGPDVLEVADRIHRLHPQVRMMILSAHTRDSYLTAAYRSGICGYFSKADDLDSILEGILEVATSEHPPFVLGRSVRERCLDPVTSSGRRRAAKEAGSPQPRLESLTPREQEVLRMIGRGLSRTEIAGELARSPKTVDGHQDRLLRKLGLRSRADLMRFAIREGLSEA